MVRALDIAVVGCGIGGLASASLLRDQGHAVTIFDGSSGSQPNGTGLIIQPVGQQILADLGILGLALSHGVKLNGLTGRNQYNGRSALSARYNATDADKFGLGIHRGTLVTLLLQAAQARQIKIQSDHMVLAMDSSETPYLRIEGNRQAGPYDLVIDASGSNSQISPLVTRNLAYGALWCVVDLPETERDLGNCLRQRYINASKMAGVLPLGTLPGDTTAKAALFWSLKRSEYEDWRDADIADWKAEAAAFWPDFGYLLEQIERHGDVTYATYSQGSLTKVYNKRLVHIGDAAHRASPQLGQGANMALLDAALLAEAVAQSPINRALPLYQRRRMLHLKTYQCLSRLMTPLYQSDSQIRSWMRDRILTPLSKTELGTKLVSRIISGDLIDPFWGRRKGEPDAEQMREILRGPGE